ncbi:N-acetylglucosamine-6-phosphate deacetylase [uncultured Mucilaginibacter sp.]|uniref:N-acetylglucosamine-6-phosphate deacetylase n=1 Tax=uncultured Mucilaginibacter sp. TaxID=797541 RepID=UPI0025F2B286|nr:N-acetylglucosamine-6-phosphate deacetylase [uncultured Mucilaginibacter sp.]
MDSSSLKIINAKIITPEGVIDNGTLIVENEKIKLIAKGNVDYNAATLIDANGKYLSPGFIDIHVHGGGGHDFMDNTIEAFLTIAKLHAQFGTTALTPTTLSCEKEDLLVTLGIYKEAHALNSGGAAFIGLHIEGPYFAMNQRGAQDPRFIRNPDPEEYIDILENNPQIRRWSAAPELEGALEFGRYMASKGVLPAIAHTEAIYEEVIAAFNSGFTHVTHLYSCTSTVSRRNAYRYAGVVESAFLLDDMTVEIIADGVHLPAALLKLVYKLKGANRIALVTDAMRAAGMPAGESILGGLKNGLKVIVEGGVAKLPDRTAFAGSVATADQLIRNMVFMADVPLIDAVKMISETPAAIMGVLADKGTLEPGKDADLVLFDEQINVQCTIIKGKVVYQA